MSYESDAVASLQEAGQGAYSAAWEAGASFAKAATAVSRASDIVDCLARTIDLLVQAEALHTAADAAVKDIRAAIAAKMDAIGCTAVQGTHHSAHLAKKPAFLNVSDEALIPREWFVQPPPQLDKRALKAALKDRTIPGCHLATPNEMVLVLRPRKEPTP